MFTARKRKRFALERQESGARSGRASLSSGLWKSNDNLVDPFLLLYGLSESGLKYDIATYHEQMLLGLCLKNAPNNPNKSSESVRLVLSMVFSVWQDDIAGLNPSIWNIIMLLLMVEKKSKVTSINTAKKRPYFQWDSDWSMTKRYFSVSPISCMDWQLSPTRWLIVFHKLCDKSRKIANAFAVISHVSRRRWSRHFGHTQSIVILMHMEFPSDTSAFCSLCCPNTRSARDSSSCANRRFYRVLLIIAICHKFWVIVTAYRSRGFIRGTVVCKAVGGCATMPLNARRNRAAEGSCG